MSEKVARFYVGLFSVRLFVIDVLIRTQNHAKGRLVRFQSRIKRDSPQYC